MKSVISCALSPNLRFYDVVISLRSLVSPHDYYFGDALNYSSLFLKRLFQCPGIFLFMRARDGEFMLLQSLGIGKNDEVIVQAFTCAAVVQPILWSGGKPVYVDISEKTLSIDPDDLEKKISPKTRLIILQSTFGIPPDLPRIRRIARRHKIFLLVDLAHMFDTVQMAKMKADGYLLSFGRDKAVSSVTGGGIVIHDSLIAEKIERVYRDVPFPSSHEIMRFLLQPLFTHIIQRLFYLHSILGKSANRAYKKSKIVPRPVGNELVLEDTLIQKYPNALAKLLFVQLNASDFFNKKRIEWSQLYEKYNLLSVPYKKLYPLLRVPYRTEHKKELMNFCKEDMVYLGDWYTNVIDPSSIPLAALKYKKKSCPMAEKLAREVVNLPVNPTLRKQDIMRVIRLIKKYEAGIS